MLSTYMHNTHNIIFLTYTSLLALTFLWPFASAHADVDVIQNLDFGEVFIPSNDSVHSITINTNGSYSFSADIYELSAPEEGIYEIDGLPANTVVASVVITQIQPLTGSSNFFNMSGFQTLFTNTDALGVSQITLGATAETTGNGMPYTNQNYNGQLQIQINF